MGNLSDDIIKYKKGELSPEQMHALERKALVDPFLAEALEGIENISSEDLIADISVINEKIVRKKKTILFTPLRFAAGIVLLVACVFIVYQFIPKPKTIALKTEKPKPEIKSAEEKQGGGNEKGDEKKESEKLKVESGKLKLESEEQKANGPKPPVLSSQRARIGKHESSEQKNQISKTKAQTLTEEIQQPLQVPAQELASGEIQTQADVEKITEEKPKEIVVQEEKAAAKAIAIDRKKEGFVRSEVGRGAMPAANVKIGKTISGQVVSAEDSSPLPGVNVIISGTTIGTVTDANGNYTLSLDDNSQRLVFSFIGFQSQEVDVSNRIKVDVEMKDDVSQLSEVVVTGMGVAKDEDDEPVIKWAEPVGGRKAYDNYLESNLKYPEEALKNKIKGKAGIEFTVGTDGAVSDFQVIKKLGYGCEEEIIRLVKEGPKWVPTTEDNKPIESTVRIKLRFDPAKAGR